jgi:SPP1 family predicted phage head-tail adaptor
MKTPIGAMDQRITLQRVTRTQDSYGGNVETWVDLCTVWAHVKPLAGREVVDAERVSPVTRFRAVVWWKGDANGAPFYTAADRVIWRGRQYGIESVVPLGRNERMELRLVEGAVT